MNKWLTTTYKTTDGKIKSMGKIHRVFETFRTEDKDLYIVVHTPSTPTDGIKDVIESSLPPTDVRDGIVVYEGTTNEIALQLNLDATNHEILNTLRVMKNDNPDHVQYSGDGRIKPKAKFGKGLYWRIHLKSIDQTKDNSEQSKKKLKFK